MLPEIMSTTRWCETGEGGDDETETVRIPSISSAPSAVGQPSQQWKQQLAVRLDNNNNNNNYNESIDNLQHFMVKFDHIMSQNKLIFNKMNSENKLMRNRIIELEDVLKESVTIVANREKDFEQLDAVNREYMQKVSRRAFCPLQSRMLLI